MRSVDPMVGIPSSRTMRHVIEISEVLGTIETPKEGACELCVSVEGDYDESKGCMTVTLESFLRPAGLLVKERHFRMEWMPAGETVTEAVSRDECRAVARELLAHWVRKVREAAPKLHPV